MGTLPYPPSLKRPAAYPSFATEPAYIKLACGEGEFGFTVLVGGSPACIDVPIYFDPPQVEGTCRVHRTRWVDERGIPIYVPKGHDLLANPPEPKPPAFPPRVNPEPSKPTREWCRSFFKKG